jgi:hypothetical protein
MTSVHLPDINGSSFERQNLHHVCINSDCPHCGTFNMHRARNFYRIFICVEARCDKCQNSYYIIPPQIVYPNVECSKCEERVGCLLNGSVLALAWKEGHDSEYVLREEGMYSKRQRNWIRNLQEMKEDNK